MNPLDSFPSDKLTSEVEAAYHTRIKRGDDAAAAELAVAAMHEAVTYTRHVCGAKIADEELISICYDVLLRGARRFDPKYKVRFVAFCKPGLRGYARRSWKQKDVIKGVSHDKMSHDGAATGEKVLYSGEHDIDPWDDPKNLTPDHEVLDDGLKEVFTKERWSAVSEIISRRCKPREKAVLELVYQGGYNFSEIAKLLGVTRSAIQSTHAGAIKKLRAELLAKKRLFTE